MPRLNPELSASNVEEALESSNSITELAEYLGVSRQTLYNSKYPHVQAALEALRSRPTLDAGMTIEMSADMRRWLEHESRAEGVSVGQFIREWLMRHPGYSEWTSQYD